MCVQQIQLYENIYDFIRSILPILAAERIYFPFEILDVYTGILKSPSKRYFSHNVRFNLYPQSSAVLFVCLVFKYFLKCF